MRTGFQQAALQQDMRSEGRHKLYLATTASQAGDRQGVEILDLSANGMLLSTQAEIDPAQPLSVVLTDGREHLATVAWHSGELYGCRFDEPLPRAELSANLLGADPARRRDDATARGSLGQRIRALRTASPHSMEELAHLAGVSKPTLWKWETDKVRPRQNAIERLAAVLGVDEIELLYGTEREARTSVENAGATTGGRTVAQVVDHARLAIASAAGVAPAKVRIEIDFR